MAVLPKRFEKYGLTLHPDKTRVIRFQRPPRNPKRSCSADPSTPGSFDLLGFTHYWGRSRQGNWVIKRKTTKGRLSRALKRINTWCRRYRHAKVACQHQQLVLKVRGHYAYYGITGSDRGLRHFRYGVMRRWKRWLNRRSQRSGMDWDRFNRLVNHYPLPSTRVVRAKCLCTIIFVFSGTESAACGANA